MKRIISYLLAAVLIFTPCFQIYAADVNGGGTELIEENDASSPEQQNSELSDTAGTEGTTAENDAGKAEGTDSAGSTKDTGSTENPSDATDTGGAQDTGNTKDPESTDSAGSTGGTTSTSDEKSQEQTKGTSDAKKEKTSEDQKEDGKDEDKPVAGQVDVTIQSALILEKAVPFTVSLTGQSSKTVTLKEDSGTEPSKGGVTFDGLKSGEYTLEVSAPGFAKYTQKIKVDGWAYTVQLMTGFTKGYEYGKDLVHPGVLLIGDVDGDGAVNDADKEKLINAIDKKTEPGSSSLDLNGDGKVDIIDLEYFVKGYKEDRDTSSVVGVNVPASAVEVKKGDNTIVDGSLDALLKDEGRPVTLKREDGQPIGAGTPVSVTFDLAGENGKQTDGIVIHTGKENTITNTDVKITYLENGKEQTIDVPLAEGVHFLLKKEDVKADLMPDGSLWINLGSQIAVKKVTLTIKGMKKNNNLAEISKVEFVNGMENRIPEPEMDIPQNLKVTAGSKSFTATWDPCINVTGYEVSITHVDDKGEKEDVQSVRGNRLEVTSFDGGKLVNKEEYKVKVQSVNGAWRSGYGKTETAVPMADKKPDAPDYLKTTGQYRAVTASWKDMDDTDYYNLFYRKSGESSYKKVEKISSNSYTIGNLEDETDYEVYVTGVNDLGESGPSVTSKARTTTLEPAKMPRYRMINYAEEGEVSEHIIKASAPKNTMQDSPKDTEEGTAFGTVDNNYNSYYLLNSWDSGGYNPVGQPMGQNAGLIYEFDKAYKMECFALQGFTPQNPDYFYAKVRYWDEQNNEVNLQGISLQKKTDDNNRSYYMISFPEPVTAKKIQFGLARYSSSGTITVSEVYFYHYDSLADDIDALYEDNLHIKLKDDVTQETIDELRERVNTKDEVSGEYHPDREGLLRELEEAEELLKMNLMEVIKVHSTITTADMGRGFGGLNAWQPLGVTAAAGEKITVYAGSDKGKTGDNTALKLVATQYHADAQTVGKEVATLKIGRNDITIPKYSTMACEAGGALYVQYTGKDTDAKYGVRVSGGTKVPVLDLYQTADSAERLQKAEKYLTELEAYTQKMEEQHNKLHKDSGNSSVNYDYDEKNCILGASDILLDTMLLSLPAKQIYAGTGSGGISAKAQTLVNSMDAIESMMYLFYQHKGLNKNAADQIDQYSPGHLNIRYQRMFAGAFMYASGNHIGIEWPETASLMCGVPVQSDADGRYESGRYFGWGIAHEIGHCINQGSYAVAEITNNYFSVLAQAKDTNESVRFKYDEVYKKVTSNTKGPASNVFTQLGMYWQLHLAYDNGYNYKTYEEHADQLENLFFARVDAYSRTPSKAPGSLTLSGDTDQVLMRLSCAAAEKNLLEFFERWGMTPDETTKNYAETFKEETRAIWYANDEARVYRLENKQGSLAGDRTTEAVGDGTSATVNKDKANQVDFELTSQNIPASDILGYEIVRYTTSEGKQEKELAGFVTKEKAEAEVFHDYVTTMNNRVVTYGVTVVDKYLNCSKEKILKPLKIEHDGSLDKANWTVTDQGIEAVKQQPPTEAADGDPCAPKEDQPIQKVIDNDSSTTYTGTASANAEILLEFNRTHTITGFKYTVSKGTPIKDYRIDVRSESGEWKTVASGTFGSDESQTVYFGNEGNEDNKSVATYNTSAVRLAIQNQANTVISISELDVLGVTGDNVDFMQSQEGTPAIGTLREDFQYSPGEGHVIPKGSIIFTGTYKGNPAYNTVIVYDQDGNIVGGIDEEGQLKASQIILADVPEKGNLISVSDGTWIYWIEPKDNVDLGGLKKVRAELYRVNNAMTNEGQRLVSDSLFETMPETLPEITLSSGKTRER